MLIEDLDVGFGRPWGLAGLGLEGLSRPPLKRKGGGSTSGEVSYPDYMENRHDGWLAEVTTAMSAARAGSSPYAGFVTVNPADVFGSLPKTPAQALADFDGVNPASLYGSYYATNASHNVEVPGPLSDQDISTIVDAEVAKLEAVRDTRIQPAFEAGMRDIGAVMSSAFVIGLANINSEIMRDAAQLDAKLRANNPMLGLEKAKIEVQQTQGNQETAHRLVATELDSHRLVVVLATEIARIYSAARLDADKVEVEMAAKDRLFDLETFQYGANVMASISGGTAHSSPQGSTIGTAIGGALSGAAAGAMVAGAVWGSAAGPAGMAIGAALGLAGALMT